MVLAPGPQVNPLLFSCSRIQQTRHTQPRFTTASLRSPDGPFPELRAKAYNASEMQ